MYGSEGKLYVADYSTTIMPSVAVLGLNRFGEQVYDYLTSHDETTVLGLFSEESQYPSLELVIESFARPVYLTLVKIRVQDAQRKYRTTKLN